MADELPKGIELSFETYIHCLYVITAYGGFAPPKLTKIPWPAALIVMQRDKDSSFCV